MKVETTQKNSILQDYEFAYNNKKRLFKKKNRLKYNTRDKKMF